MENTLQQDTFAFFNRHPGALPLYELFYKRLTERFPQTRVKVQKSQISFSNRHMFACISFLRVKKSAELPENWFTLTLGLPEPLDSPRVAAKTEPYPGRWTTHFVITGYGDMDGELFGWIDTAYRFAERKGCPGSRRSAGIAEG